MHAIPYSAPGSADRTSRDALHRRPCAVPADRSSIALSPLRRANERRRELTIGCPPGFELFGPAAYLARGRPVPPESSWRATGIRERKAPAAVPSATEP